MMEKKLEGFRLIFFLVLAILSMLCAVTMFIFWLNQAVDGHMLLIIFIFIVLTGVCIFKSYRSYRILKDEPELNEVSILNDQKAKDELKKELLKEILEQKEANEG